MSLLVHDKWSVHVLRLSGVKAHAIGVMLQQHPTLFPDGENPEFAWDRLMHQIGLVWLGVYEGEILVGLIYLDFFAPGGGNVEVHLMFFDRKPAEKTELLRQLLPIVLQTFPKIKRLTTTIPSIYKHTWRLARRIGMHWEGTMKNAQTIRGVRRDVHIFGLLREEVI